MAIGTRTPRSFSAVFNSSVPQRPSERPASRQFGGRPLGPMTYHPPSPSWHNDPAREMAIFQSKTLLRTYETPLTAQLDFLGHAGQLTIERSEAPLSRGLPWPDPPPQRPVHRDPGLDEFCNATHFSVSGDVSSSSRKYASSFASTAKRAPEPPRPTSPMLGPGVYETALDSVRVRDPKRQNYTFKSETNSSVFGAPAGQPPDTVQSIQSAILGRHWTYLLYTSPSPRDRG